jgi:phospholipase C
MEVKKILVWAFALCPVVFVAQHAFATLESNTPIKHVVVIFDENISFDHDFGTYPNASNQADEPPSCAAPGTPVVNGLTATLLNHNANCPNLQRLNRSQALTADMNHEYSDEQSAFDGGLMDKFKEKPISGVTS